MIQVEIKIFIWMLIFSSILTSIHGVLYLWTIRFSLLQLKMISSLKLKYCEFLNLLIYKGNICCGTVYKSLVNGLKWLWTSNGI